MGFVSYLAYLLIAYGPSITIFILYISRSAQLVILVVSSAFFWLISILISSIYWFIANLVFKYEKLENANSDKDYYKRIIYLMLISVLSVFTQELFRWLFWKLLNKAEAGLNAMSEKPKSPLNKYHFSFASGLGFGVMSGLVSYSTVLADSLKPGTILCGACPTMPMPFIAALITSIFVLLHIVWSIIAFNAFEKKEKLLIAWVFIGHLMASLATILTYTDRMKFGCPICFVILVSILGYTTYIAFKRFTKIKMA
ncbi:Aph-1 [Piromyces finnis]|uniref:Aph-1 n=1 Tax=Piromyces finnis TaxID=1754191 RepID=A0A1Y1V618_9FUNG|nr:Aph-1 [Piromyces finnis]|eukprot:ORX48138.1 Aph-1 [Piromyces finnis]